MAAIFWCGGYISVMFYLVWKAKNPEKRWSAEKNAWVTEVVHCADT